MLCKLAIKIAKLCCDRLFSAHSANFIILTFVVVSRNMFWWDCLRPLACCARGQMSFSAPWGGRCPHWLFFKRQVSWGANVRSRVSHSHRAPSTRVLDCPATWCRTNRILVGWPFVDSTVQCVGILRIPLPWYFTSLPRMVVSRMSGNSQL